MDESRRSMLLAIKLRALVVEHLGTEIGGEPESIRSGAALVHADSAWVLLDGDASRSLGVALSWAHRRGASSVNVIGESGLGTLARRATAFRHQVTVWRADERLLQPVTATPLPDRPMPPTEHLDLIPMIEAAGASPNHEHGIVFGEVRGLEVCRVVDQPTTGVLMAPDDDPLPAPKFDGLQLEVGVGSADREAFQMMHGDIPTPDALAGVVAAVVQHRSAEAPQHPLNRLGRERYLRWEVEVDPARAGLVSMVASEPPLPRPNLKDPIPCVGIGLTADGVETSVVFSSGIDLDLVPFIADVQAMNGTPVIAALPARDVAGLTRDLAGLLTTPIEFIALD